MPSIDLLVPFLLAAGVFAYLPGPAMLYATAQTIARGRRAGWMAAFGIHLGGYAHVAAAALGLAVLFEIVPVLYTVLKIAGAAYLIWLGLKLIHSKESLTDTPIEIEAKSPRTAFWESVTVEGKQRCSSWPSCRNLATQAQLSRSGCSSSFWARS